MSSSADPSPRVLIVGAGIAGLALARALSLRGLRADIVESHGKWRTEGFGLYLPANAVRMLEALEIGDAVAAKAHPIVRQQLLTPSGRRLIDIDLGDFWGDVGRCVAISRLDLHAALWAVTDPATVRQETSLVSANDGHVTFSDGSTGFYELVVGADGIGSAVRHSAFGEVRPRFLNQVCWRFIAEGFPDVSGWTARLGSGGRTFLTVPLGDGRVYCYAEISAPDPGGPGDDWPALFADFTGPVPALLRHSLDAHFAPLAEIAGSDWVRPRTVLIGDAAHACSPSMAQGGAMAMEDAVVLAEVLHRLPVEQALAAYLARREPRVAWVLAQNHRRDRARRLPTPVRNLLLRRAGALLFRANHAPLHEMP
jgi:2-polyprenyl-6-methoxyphenol hydroxylase-like FAD-dependent oxidoreductase